MRADDTVVPSAATDIHTVIGPSASPAGSPRPLSHAARAGASEDSNARSSTDHNEPSPLAVANVATGPPINSSAESGRSIPIRRLSASDESSIITQPPSDVALANANSPIFRKASPPESSYEWSPETRSTTTVADTPSGKVQLKRCPTAGAL